MTNMIEGVIKPGQKAVLVEDLISTGGSSLRAVSALENAGCEVLGMLAIFTYGFKKAEDSFISAGCRLDTLSTYNSLVERALETGFITAAEIDKLKEWRMDPSIWGK